MKIKQVLNSVNTKHIRSQLRDLYHRKGPGRKPINPLAMLKTQLLKHLLRIPSDRRMALRLKHDRKAVKVCGFGKRTPSYGLFTHFRHRLGQDTYNRIFNQLLHRLLEAGAVKGDVIAVDSTHVDAYSQRSKDNRARAEYVVQHRFKHEDNWPLMQIGPGIFTFNDTAKYEWGSYSSEVNDALIKLYGSYPEKDDFKINQLQLRYIDAFSFDFNDNALDFLSKNLKFRARALENEDERTLTEEYFDVLTRMSDGDRLWYVAGTHMSQMIDRRLGRKVLNQTIVNGPDDFFEAYDRAIL